MTDPRKFDVENLAKLAPWLRSGPQTSEFKTMLLALVLGLILMLLAHQNGSEQLMEFAGWLIALAIPGYQLSRGLAKQGAPK